MLRLWTCRCCRLTPQREVNQGMDALLGLSRAQEEIDSWSWTYFLALKICPSDISQRQIQFIGRSRERAHAPPTHGLKCSQFYAGFFWTIWQNRILVPPGGPTPSPTGNPGSAPAIPCNMSF